MSRLLALALGLLVLTGCPREKRALDASRKAVEIAAETVALVDRQVADQYGQASRLTLDACETLECYEEVMVKWEKTVVAVNSMKYSLLLVEQGLDAWEAGSPNGRANLRDAAACFLGTIDQLSRLLREVGAKTDILDHGQDYARDLFGLQGVVCQGAN